MLAAASLALLFSSAPQAPARASVVEDRRLELEAAAANERAAATVEIAFEGPATVVAIAESDDLDPRVSLFGPGGAPLNADDDSGGGTIACTWWTFAERGSAAIRVEAEELGAAGAARLRFAIVPESAETVGLGQVASEVARRARELAGEGRGEEAAALARAEIERVFALPGAGESWCAAETLPLLAYPMIAHGDYAAALPLAERSLESRTTYLPRAHRLRRAALNNVVRLSFALGRDCEVGEIARELLAACEIALAPAVDERINATLMSAQTYARCGDLARADELARRALDAATEAGTADTPIGISIRTALAQMRMAAGDLQAARALYERCYAVLSGAVPEDDLQLQVLKMDLGWVLCLEGDLEEARELQTSALAVSSRAYVPDDPELQRQRMLLALTLSALGEHPAAQALEEEACASLARVLSPGQPELVTCQFNLAVSRLEEGDVDGALAVLETCVEGLASDASAPPELSRFARRGLALALSRKGELSRARELLDGVLAERLRDLPPEHVQIEATRGSLFGLATGAGERGEALAIAHDILRARNDSIASAVTALAPREVAAFARRNAEVLDGVLSFGCGLGSLAPARELDAAAFEAIEAMRGAELASARLVRRAMREPKLAETRARGAEAAAEIARALESPLPGAVADAVRARDLAQSELVAALGASGSSLARPPGVDTIAAALGQREAAVGFWRYVRFRESILHGSEGQPALLAFVLRRDGNLARFELGPADAIERAVERWRDALVRVGDDAAGEQRAAGVALRELVLDPLRPALGSVERIHVALDDALHVVPLDALPEEGGLVGDALELRMRASLWEIAFEDKRESVARDLVVFGGIDYGAPAGASDGTRAGSFVPLPETAAEADAIAAIFRGLDQDGPRAELRSGTEASRAALEALAPRSRWLHLSTHGYFAPPGVASYADERPIDARVPEVSRLRVEDEVRQLSPMALCGLALANANGASDALGRRPGVVTAEELAALDLSGCELACLSGCDTGVGERRAGRGVASLQRALHMAGARTVVTSLWKVSDAATSELMSAFYRRMWVERLSPARALWGAKRELRQRRAPPRDWAGWVISS